MKKALTFLTLIIVAVCGVLFGCDKEKYANLKVELESPNFVGETLVLYYGQETDLNAIVSGVKGINKSVDFSCSDPDALEFTKQNNHSKGSSVKVKALKPTYDNLFILSAKSVETASKFAEVKVKVILPIQSLDFKDDNGNVANVAVSHSIPLNLYEHISFYPKKPFVTNQRDVNYVITNYGINNQNNISIDEKGILTVTEDVVDNMVTPATLDNCLTIKVISKDNPSISEEVRINVIRDIDASSVILDSAQVSFNGMHENKTNMVLFSNSTDLYNEVVSVTVPTGQEIAITPIISGDNNIIEATHLPAEDGYTTVGGQVVTRTQKFRIRARSIRGISYVNFKIKIKNIANDMEYLLSDDAKITVEVSGIPRSIDLKQDGTSQSNNSTLIVYDTYKTTATTMAYGSKIVLNVSSNSNSEVDEANKYLKVEILDVDKDVSGFFEICNVNGIPIQVENGFFTILSNNAFYLKATQDSIGKTFTLRVTTVIEKYVEYANGSASNPQSELVTNEYFVTSNYGVNEITSDKREYVLKLYEGVSAQNIDKTQMLLTFNANADTSNIQANYNPNYVEVEKIDSFKFLLTGLKIGETTVEIVANNGFTQSIRVRIVKAVNDVLLKVDNPISSQIITQSTNNFDGELEKVSAKAGGRFNIYSVVNPHISGIISYEYSSSESRVATVNTSGIVVTRGEGTTLITVTANYYKFELDADSYLTMVEAQMVKTFELTVFIPTTRITLNRTNLTVYSADSLGYEYKDQSLVEVYALMSPATATIYDDPTAVTYTLIGDNGNLVELARGRYQANLNPGENSAIVIVAITVREFGTSTTLSCIVNIKRATQIKTLSVDNLPKAGDVYLLNMRQSETHELKISYDPTDVYINALKFMLYTFDIGNAIEFYPDNAAVSLITIDGNNIISNPTESGTVYLRIFAKDNMQSLNDGTVYVDICINVADGSLENPYVITNVSELKRIGDAPTKHYLLGNNIDLTGEVIEPLTEFSGTLNGYYHVKAVDGGDDLHLFHSILNLTVESHGDENIGLFSSIASTGAIFNVHLTVSRISVTGDINAKNIGTFAGVNNGLIMNCSVEINDFLVSSYDGVYNADEDYINVGGMVGANHGYVFNFASTKGNQADPNDTSLPISPKYLVDDFTDTFENLIAMYSTGEIINNELVDLTVNEYLEQYTPYTNIVDGTIVVRDTIYQAINAGGIAGMNTNVINGIYGIFNRIDESSYQDMGATQDIVFTATIQNQGIDVSVNITPNGADTKNSKSAYGSIVGYNFTDALNFDPNYGGAAIYNVSSSGKITGHYNVGGIVGKAEGINIKPSKIMNANSSTKIVANTYVGGAIGYAKVADVDFVRVESYQDMEDGASDNIFIEAKNSVGGVVGYSENSNLMYVYSVSFSDIKKSTTKNVRVQNNDFNVLVGGVVGNAVDTHITYAYSKFRLDVVATAGSAVGGIVGKLEGDSKIFDSYFVGRVAVAANSQARAQQGALIGQVAHGTAAGGLKHSFVGGDISVVGTANVVGQYPDGWYSASDATITSNKNSANVIFASRAGWITNSSLNDGWPVITYQVDAIPSYNATFVKLVPTTLSVAVNNRIDPTIDALRLSQNNILLKYSSNNTSYNTYNIKELFNISVEPAQLKTASLLVTSSNPLIAKVTNDGKLITLATGTITLQFVARLNTNLKVTITVHIIQKVTSMKLFTNSNLVGNSLIQQDQDLNYLNNQSVSVRRGSTQKLFPVYYCDDVMVYPNFEVIYTIADETYFTITDEIIYALEETNGVEVDVRVIQKPGSLVGIGGEQIFFGADPTDRDQIGKITFSVKVYSGATGIVARPNSKIQLTAAVPQQISFELLTDATLDSVAVEIIDEQGNVYYEIAGIKKVRDAAGRDYEDDEAQALYNALKINDITMLFELGAGGEYVGNIALSVKRGFEYTTSSTTYKIKFIALSNEAVTKTVEVELVPQRLLHIEGIYYQFDKIDTQTSDFIFKSEPTSSIIPARFGLLSINTDPIYSGVESFSLYSTGANGNVNFSQLVKNLDDATLADVKYRFAPHIEIEDQEGVTSLLRLSNFHGTYTITRVTGEYEKYPSIYEENGYIYIKMEEKHEIVNGDSTYYYVYEQYSFDGNLYVQLISGTDLYLVKEFQVHVNAIYGDGEVSTYSYTFEVEDLPGLKINTTRDVISIGSKEEGISDSIDIAAELSNGEKSDLIEISYNTYSGATLQPKANVAHVNSEGKLTLLDSAAVGDYIEVIATYVVNVDGKEEVISEKRTIKVVDVVLEDMEIANLQEDGLLTFTVSSTMQLKANIIGPGSTSNINNKSMEISRQLVGTNTIAYWKYVRGNGNFVNIDDTSLVLPFSITKSFVGQAQAIVSMVGSTQSGTVAMALSFYYYYNDEGVLCFTDNPDVPGAQLFTKTFTVQVRADSNADRPIPIYTEDDLRGMTEGGNYILMADIVIERHAPLTTRIASLDGNNKIITIKNFAYDDGASGTASTSINLGLFDSIDKNTIIKNLIVALPNDKVNPMNLTNYKTINIGGIAAENAGIITNCEVISTYSIEDYDLLEKTGGTTSTTYYSLINYTLNVKTSVQLNGELVKTTIGGLVAKNTATGRITNSRVGREEVTVITPKDNNGTTYSEDIYKYTAPITIMRLEGSGDIGGFAGINEGIISSSYFRNGQIEIVTFGSQYTQVGGFVAQNTGGIYGSYAAGWEEDKEGFVSANGSLFNYNLSKSANPESNSVSSSQFNASRRIGGGLFSNANIAGFVYQNGGVITNSYSALNLSGNYTFAANKDNISTSTELTEFGNLNAGGFVYNNIKDARIETSYSISKLKSNITTHGAFVGVSPIGGDVQNAGVVDKCYYLVEVGESIYGDYDPAYSIAQSLVLEGVTINTNEFIEKGSFAGFSFDNNNYEENMLSGAIWGMNILQGQSGAAVDRVGYPELIAANNVAISLRVLRVDDNDPNSYSYIYVQDFEKGSINNPQIITSAQEYNNLFNDILSSTTVIENINVKYTGHIRLVTNIDFTGLTAASSNFEYSSKINSMSIFDGNNMFMSNILLSDDSAENTAFGLFKSFNRVGVKNLVLTINKVSSTNGIAVGALAGVVVNSDINNVSVVAANDKAAVSGKNFVGGVAGIILAGDEKNLHYVNNVQANVAVLASYTSEGTPSIIKSGDIWNFIIPPAEIEGSTSTDYNLRLQYLPTNVSYAGGIAGVVDLLQAFKAEGSNQETSARLSLANVNVRSANVGNLKLYSTLSSGIELENSVNIEAEYAGGIFGFIGVQTYFKEGYFIVYDESSTHYINSTVAAGGITAINYGYIEQTYVAQSDEKQVTLDQHVQSLVNGTANITWGNQNFYTGKPTYIGGIAGINVGNRYANSGTIKNSFNRIDLRNKFATRIGGIVGATHIGGLINVFTTGNIMGDFTKEDTYFGQVIGQLLDNINNNFYMETILADSLDSTYELELSNIVAITTWNPNDFDKLKLFTDTYGFDYHPVGADLANPEEAVKVKIGAIYAPYHQKFVPGTATLSTNYVNYERYVKKLQSGTGTYLLSKIFKGYNPIKDTDSIDLYTGYEDSSSNGKLYAYVTEQPSSVIRQETYADLFTVQTGVVSDAKSTIFNTTVWSDRIWLFDDSRAMITLKYGYIPNISQIYTAEDFLAIINEDPASSRTYIIMNDLDFSGVVAEGTNINIGSNFRGTITGIKIKSSDGSKERYPILFNIVLRSNKNDTSIFTSTTNASMNQFSVVISQYEENYQLDAVTQRAVDTRSSVLIGTGTNTVVSNVHIYNNITEIVNHEFIKLHVGDSDGSDVFYSMTGTETNSGLLTVKYNSLSGIELLVTQVQTKIITSANYFGGFVANASGMTISYCTFNIPVEVQYKNIILKDATSLYFGGIGGRYLGTIYESTVTKNILIQSATNDVKQKATHAYFGGVVGYLAGSITVPTEVINPVGVSYGRLSNAEINFTIGGPVAKANPEDPDVTNYFEVQTHLYVGGVAGSAQILDTSETKYITRLNTHNVIMSVYTNGNSSIGGVVGINEIEAQRLVYQNNNTSEKYEDVVDNRKAEADLRVYTNSNNINTNIGGVIGKNTYGQLNELICNNSIYYKAYTDATANKAFIGGIIGKSNNTTALNVIQEGSAIVTETNVHGLTLGGAFGSIESSQQAGTATGKSVVTFAVSAIDIFVLGANNTITAGGFAGSVQEFDAANTFVYSKITITQGNLFPIVGGYIGNINMFNGILEQNSGNVVATTLYYESVAEIDYGGTIKKLEVGQLFGKMTNKAISNMSSLKFKPVIFAMYVNTLMSDESPSDFNEMTKIISRIITLPVLDNHLNAIIQPALTQVPYTRLKNYLVYITGQSNERTYTQKLGTKLNPREVTSGAQIYEDYGHYIVTNDIGATSALELKPYCFIDFQGYTVKVNGTNTTNVLKDIPVGAIVSGLLVQNANITGANNIGIIAPTNNGLMIGCGTSGSIAGANVGGVVSVNNGIMIDCFSIATVEATGADVLGGGILAKNDTRGQITTSHTTSLVTSTSGAKIGGFAGLNNGTISSSYTVANVQDITDGPTSANIYPFSQIIGSSKSQFNYYDINAYTSIHEGVAAAATKTVSLTDIYNMQYPPEGVPMDIIGTWYQNNYPMWVMEESNIRPDTVESMTNTWFNYGYSLVDVDDFVTSDVGKGRLLLMLYTGNGKEDDGGTTNGFENGPYQITNAGIFEAFVLSDNIEKVKSYYKVMNNISFKAYDNWSDEWDEGIVYFRGDFDGNGKLLTDMTSKHGLFRAVTAQANAYNFTLQRAFSKTGMLAAYMDSGNLSNITITTDLATGKTYNIDSSGLNSFTLSVGEGATSITNQMAGAYIGSMNGGTIGKDDEGTTGAVRITGDTFKIKSDDGYSGGYFGMYSAGDVYTVSDADVFSGLTTLEIEGNNVGGYVGYATELVDADLTITDKVSLTASYMLGGFVAEAVNCELTNITVKADIATAGNTASIIGGIAGKITGSDNDDMTITSSKVDVSGLGRAVNDVYVGGIVAQATNATLTNNTVTVDGDINGDIVGGIAAEFIGEISYTTGTTQVSATNITSAIADSVAGGIVAIMKGGKISGASGSKLTNNIPITAISKVGGIIGHLDNTSGEDVEIEYVVNSAKISCGTTANVGGIIGEISTTADDKVELTNISNSGTVEASGDSIHAGGIVGDADGNIIFKTCTNTADIKTKAIYLGGIVGYFKFNGEDSVNMNNCDNTASIELDGDDSNVGGIVGYGNAARLSGCDNLSDTKPVKFTTARADDTNGTTFAPDYAAGGVAGYLTNSTVTNCSNKAPIDGFVGGGIVGALENSTLGLCTNYATGKVYNSNGNFGGGIIGFAKNYTIDGDVTNHAEINSYAKSGGIVGYSNSILGYATLTSKGQVIGILDENGAAAGGIFGRFEIGDLIDVTKLVVEMDSAANTIQGYSAGGIVGLFEQGTIGTSSDKTVGIKQTITLKDGAHMGGVIGQIAEKTSVIIQNITQMREITFTSNNGVVGGIIGTAGSGSTGSILNLTNVSNSAKLIVTNAGSVGGIVGHLTGDTNTTLGKLENKASGHLVYTNTTASTYELHVGGVFGQLSKFTVTTQVINKQDIDATISGPATLKIGGIAGTINTSTITNSLSEGHITLTTASGSVTYYAGGVVGYTKESCTINYSELRSGSKKVVNLNITAALDVDGSYVGGVVGCNEKNLTLNYSGSIAPEIAGEINGNISGGAVGLANGKLELTGFTASADINGHTAVGGMVGKAVTSETKSISSCEVTSDIYLYNDGGVAGGMVGLVDGSVTTITSCLGKADIVAYDGYAGGIVGKVNTNTTITGCTVSEDVHGGKHGGGFVGNATTKVVITNNTINSNITISGTYAGGLVGKISANGDHSISGNTLKSFELSATYNGGLYGEHSGNLASNIAVQDLSNVTDLTTVGSYSGFIVGRLGATTGTVTYDLSNTNYLKGSTFRGYFGTFAGYTNENVSNLTVKYNLNSSNITASGSGVGGIIGYLDGSTLTAVSTTSATISGFDNDYVGGIVAYSSNGTLSNCDSTAAISGGSYSTGGVVGYSSGGSISSCDKTSGKISIVLNDYHYVGGIVGIISGSGTSVTSCTNAASVTANSSGATKEDANAGGIAGYTSYTTVSSCSNSGQVMSYATQGTGFSKESRVTSATTFSTTSFRNISRAGGIVGYSYYSTITSNTNYGLIYGYHSINNEWYSAAISSHDFDDWGDFLGYTHYSEHTFIITGAEISGYDYGSSFSGNSRSGGASYSSYTKGVGIDDEWWSEHYYFGFYSSGHYNDNYNSVVASLKEKASGKSV